MADLIWVKSGRKDAKIALYEQDSDHPGGSAYVAASEGPVDEKTGEAPKELINEPVQVARTSLVSQRIHEGELIEVTQAGNPKKSADAEKAEERKAEEPPAKPKP